MQAVGSPDTTRSHFDAQDFMESGTPGLKATEDGWLNRALQAAPEEQPSPFRAVAFGPYLPRTLQGSAPAVAVPDLKQFKMNCWPVQQTVQERVRGHVRACDGGSGAAQGVGQENF